MFVPSVSSTRLRSGRIFILVLIALPLRERSGWLYRDFDRFLSALTFFLGLAFSLVLGSAAGVC